MRLSQLKADQLDAYLTGLTPKAAETLMREVERDRLKGGSSFPHEFVLEKARAVLQRNDGSCDRIGSPRRVFCQPFEDLLVDRIAEEKQRGRIARSSIDPVWNWISTELVPGVVPSLDARLRSALLAENDELIEELSQRLYEVCAKALTAALGVIVPETKPYSRLAAHLGGEQVLLDAFEIRDCLSYGSEILSHLSRIPSTIHEFEDDDDELYAQWYREFADQYPDAAYILLVTLSRRCVRPSDMLRVVVAIAGTDEADVVRRQTAGVVCEVMLHDMDIAGTSMRDDMSLNVEFDDLKPHLARFHTLGSAICDTLELELRGVWGHKIVALRSDLSSRISEYIAQAPRLVKAALYRRQSSGQSRQRLSEAGSGPDPQKVADAEFSVSLLIGIRPYLGQLTLNAEYSRVKAEVEQFLEVIADRLVNNIVDGSPEEAAFAVEGLPAAGRLMEKVFGDEASELFLRRGRAAMQQSGMEATA